MDLLRFIGKNRGSKIRRAKGFGQSEQFDFTAETFSTGKQLYAPKDYTAISLHKVILKNLLCWESLFWFKIVGRAEPPPLVWAELSDASPLFAETVNTKGVLPQSLFQSKLSKGLNSSQNSKTAD
jgi:hypothetical protein